MPVAEIVVPVRSPSQTDTFSQCPRLWALDHAGWRPRLVEYPELCGILGTGFADGITPYNLALMAGKEPNIKDAIGAGEASIDAQLELLRLDGRMIGSTKDNEFCASMPKLLAKAVKMYDKQNPYKGMKIVGVEKKYPNFGNCRTDLELMVGEELVVIDYKLKVKLYQDWKQKTLKDYEHSWQQYHYMYATGAKQYGICLIVLGPTPYVEHVPYLLDKEYQPVWITDAAAIWNHMNDIENERAPLYGRTDHELKYGMCPFEKACTTYGLNGSLMNVEYVQVERLNRKKEVSRDLPKGG